MQFLASFPIAFTLAILANGLLASLIKERCAHDLSHCTVSADGVMYAALFLMVLGLATWNVHVLGRGCLVAALAFMLACAVASVSMSIDVLSEQHMELARSPFQNAAMSCCNGLVVGFLGRFSVQRHQMLACMRLCVGLHAFATVVTVVRSGNRTALIVTPFFLLFGVFVFIGWVTGHGAKEAQGAGAAETSPTVVDEQAPLLSQPISCVLRSAERRASREAQRRFELAGICRLLCKYPGVLESVAVAQPHRWWRRAPCPPSPPPSPASPLSLQLMLAGQILVEALNGSDESTKDELLRLIESCGYTVRSDEEEAALRQLVNLADVNSAAALGEPPSLDDAAMWADACFMQLREQSRMEISAEEICEFLSDAYENAPRRGDDAEAEGFESITLSPEEAISGRDGKVAVFYVATADPHPGITNMLDALGVPHARTVFREHDAILGFISHADEGVRNSAGGADGEARAWGVAVPDWDGEAAPEAPTGDGEPEGEDMEVLA